MPIRSSVYLPAQAGLFSVLLFLAFALGFLTGNFYPHKLFAPPLTVVRVLDGDTVELSDHRHLRLRGINTPELNKHECLAEAAKDRLSQLLLNQAITLEATTAVVDNFGRTVAVITLKDYRGEGYQLPNSDPAQVLVREGLARSAGPFPSEAYQEKLFTLEETAKDAGLGLWNPDACPQPTPVPANCNIKGNIHWKKRQKLYFPPDCTGYARVTIEPKNGDRWFCSAEEAAAAGFTLAATCLPR